VASVRLRFCRARNLLVLLAVTALASACGAAPRTTRKDSVRRFTGDGLTFNYPAVWRRKGGWNSLSASALVMHHRAPHP
jgi:hypothetical protein